jgi:AraC-like DNA-binding protein
MSSLERQPDLRHDGKFVMLTRQAVDAFLAAVARRWGWTSHSRFSVAYQKRFGVLPSRTLRA